MVGVGCFLDILCFSNVLCLRLLYKLPKDDCSLLITLTRVTGELGDVVISQNKL